jgi:TfoX/Sxy family transcriptional regulator of competence genes
MAWRKSSPELIASFDRALPADARVERRKMFGYPAAFVNGNMMAGLHQENVILRLAEADRARLAAAGGMPFEPTPGRRMREYMVLPDAMATDAKAMQVWLKQSFDFVARLPAKGAKRGVASARRPRRAAALSRRAD